MTSSRFFNSSISPNRWCHADLATPLPDKPDLVTAIRRAGPGKSKTDPKLIRVVVGREPAAPAIAGGPL
jgi:hypothetical protein